MTLHLPYSDRPEDEFLYPNGQWMYAFRALVTDSWLLWRDALPANPASRALLSAPQVTWIEVLGDALHRIHQTLPGYAQLEDSPFEVRRWLDPHDSGTPWHEGRRCHLRLDGVKPERFLAGAKGVVGPRWLNARELEGGWIEATALAIPVRNRRKDQRSRGSRRA